MTVIIVFCRNSNFICLKQLDLLFQVAARVRLEDADKDDWFIVKVIHFDRESRE